MTAVRGGQDEAVVITGASTGIGEATALRLDRQGFRVFAGVRKPADAEALQRKASARLVTLLLDVTDQATIDRAAAQVGKAVGPAGIAGLVNNAGVSGGAPLEYLALDDLRRIFEVNVVGALAMTQALLPLLRARPGRVVMVGSIAGLVAFPLSGAYCASKFALEGLTDVLRLELKSAGIDVIIIEPGAIATPIWAKGGEAADRLLEGLSASARRDLDERYGAMLKAGRESARRSAERGLAPDKVAAVIESLLTERRPPSRVVVGRDATMLRLLRALLPVRRLDRMRLRWSGQRQEDMKRASR